MLDTMTRLPPNVRATRGRADTTETGEFLMMSSDASEDGTAVRLIGSYPGRALLITAPEIDGRLLFVKEGQAFHFRSFYAQAVYAFATTIQKVCFTPFPYVHLEWPASHTIERTVVRSSRRVDVKLPCAVYWTLDGKPCTYNGTVRNLSSAGAELHIGKTLPARAEGLRIALRISAAGQNFVIECPVRIMRHEMIPGRDDATIDKYGLALQELSPESSLALHAFVYETAITRLETPIYAHAPMSS